MRNMFLPSLGLVAAVQIISCVPYLAVVADLIVPFQWFWAVAMVYLGWTGNLKNNNNTLINL